MNPRFSICIPTYEQGGNGVKHLKRLLESIESQTFKDYEIIISDHSRNNEVMSYTEGLDCKYIWNPTKYGNGPANTNSAIVNASGELIKIMFQDDLMHSPDCLSIIDENFDEYTDWLVVGCNHSHDPGMFYNPMVPSWNDDIVRGVNTISSPSVLTIRNKDLSYFDENLEVMMDCDYYYQLYNRFGLPKIVPDTLITNTIHRHQISNRNDLDLPKELEYIKMKYSL